MITRPTGRWLSKRPNIEEYAFEENFQPASAFCG